MKIAYLGMGVMGGPMARHLSSAGHEVTVYNRTEAKAAAWVAAHGGSSAAIPKAAVAGAEIVFACLGNDDDVRSVIYGDDGALAGMAPGSLLVDHTTASAALARELADATGQNGIGFLDAPVSGGQAGAENGQLTIMIGGSQGDFDRALPLMDTYAKACTLMGPVGSGQLTKMVNQICIAGLVQALSEGLNFAQMAGLDGEKVLQAISQGAAGSWQMSNRGTTMLAGEFEFGFAVDWMRKDLGICFEEARANGAALPVAALTDQFYAQVQAMGGNRWDTSSLIQVLRKSS